MIPFCDTLLMILWYCINYYFIFSKTPINIILILYWNFKYGKNIFWDKQKYNSTKTVEL